MNYDFTTMSRKDIFEAKLKNDVLHFAYISSNKRAPFLKFCEDAGLVELVGKNSGSLAYKVITNFAYETMGNYRPVMYAAKVGEYLIFDLRCRPNEHIVQEMNDERAKEWLNEIMNGGKEDD